jgi:hypothetical protein
VRTSGRTAATRGGGASTKEFEPEGSTMVICAGWAANAVALPTCGLKIAMLVRLAKNKTMADTTVTTLTRSSAALLGRLRLVVFKRTEESALVLVPFVIFAFTRKPPLCL